jgi:hypothetical protein
MTKRCNTMGTRKNKKEIKQWEQLAAFLQNQPEVEDVIGIMRSSQERASRFLSDSKETSATRRELFQTTILPRIAAYAVLKERDLGADALMEKYVREVVGSAMHSMYAKAEHIPLFYSIFCKAFRHVTQKSDAWESEFEEKKGSFCLTIHKCLWYDACCACGHPQACQFFCHCDNYTYGNLKKVEFQRTQTLGTGGRMCDFVFIKK